ncbi:MULTISPECIES: MOSC domain-containing protein [unclassified Rhizobium]|jgi:MOSC domain-containing protein YiiM|uniref:MOSC domain-containing protein n=1 Tax=unclassified Rhizobium TaxID=2613769 RepID=UPI000647755B|nr:MULTISPECIES: MOSC domain-containing protein [unclassified Rhizobium]MBN8953801.1 MOSC domain-containing protein [Rhizobium tropici]OJY72391.1 MAG: MOSC domain-containing protein [Rhizobium sp. 60-20]RKD50870.1 MOSC domain-containing protein YiiM [Rhizobium sp. WW_1]
MKILAVCLGAPETLPGRKTKTGINKHAVGGAVMIDEQGLLGDAICNREHHGGRDQAVYVEGSLTLDWWASELGQSLEPGAFGENLVIDGLDNCQVAVGDKFIVGDLVLEVTSARIPCSTFAAKMGDPKFVKRYTQAGRPGIYCRVLSSGTVSVDMPVSHLPHTGERVTMPEMMATFGRRLSPKDRARYLAVPIHYKLRALIEGDAAV